MLTGCVTASFYGWLPLYLPELFPTRVRATGQGFAYNFGRVLAALGTLITGQLLNSFSEDYARTGAVTSLVYLIGLVLIFFTGQQWIDSVVAILFGAVALYMGYDIVRKSIAGIMDEADMDLLKRMLNLLNANRRENWIDCHNLRIIKYGAVLHMDCHLTVPWYFDVRQAHAEIDALADLVKKEFGESVELFVHSDACHSFSCPICDKPDCTVRKHKFEKKIEWTLDNILQDKKHRL